MRPRRILIDYGMTQTSYHDFDQLWRLLTVTHHRGAKREIQPSRPSRLVG